MVCNAKVGCKVSKSKGGSRVYDIKPRQPSLVKKTLKQRDDQNNPIEHQDAISRDFSLLSHISEGSEDIAALSHRSRKSDKTSKLNLPLSDDRHPPSLSPTTEEVLPTTSPSLKPRFNPSPNPDQDDDPEATTDAGRWDKIRHAQRKHELQLQRARALSLSSTHSRIRRNSSCSLASSTASLSASAGTGADTATARGQRRKQEFMDKHKNVAVVEERTMLAIQRRVDERRRARQQQQQQHQQKLRSTRRHSGGALSQASLRSTRSLPTQTHQLKRSPSSSSSVASDRSFIQYQTHHSHQHAGGHRGAHSSRSVGIPSFCDNASTAGTATLRHAWLTHHVQPSPVL